MRHNRRKESEANSRGTSRVPAARTSYFYLVGIGRLASHSRVVIARLANLEVGSIGLLRGALWDFLPVIKLLCLTKHRRLLSWGAPSRPVERSIVLPLPRTLRAGWRQCRCAASRTALARGALPKVGRDEGMSVPVELRDRCDLRRCRRTMVGVEQHSPLKQDAGHPEQSVGDTAQGTTI